MQRMNENRPTDNNKPLGDLFGDLASEMSNLVRQEVALAKVEVSQKAKYVFSNILRLLTNFHFRQCHFLPDQVTHLTCEIAEQVAEWLVVIRRAIFIHPLHHKYLLVLTDVRRRRW